MLSSRLVMTVVCGNIDDLQVVWMIVVLVFIDMMNKFRLKD